MKVLLIKDVYKLGHAGDVKKVADGYGRNFLIPQRLAILATAGALKQSEGIRSKADEKRAILNKEMSSVAEVLSKLILPFTAKAGETARMPPRIISKLLTILLTLFSIKMTIFKGFDTYVAIRFNTTSKSILLWHIFRHSWRQRELS